MEGSIYLETIGPRTSHLSAGSHSGSLRKCCEQNRRASSFLFGHLSLEQVREVGLLRQAAGQKLTGIGSTRQWGSYLIINVSESKPTLPTLSVARAVSRCFPLNRPAVETEHAQEVVF